MGPAARLTRATRFRNSAFEEDVGWMASPVAS